MRLLDDDKLAEKEATKKEAPNVYLLKARLLSDGGYYEKAISTILRKSQQKYIKLREMFLNSHTDLQEYITYGKNMMKQFLTMN